MIDPIKCSPAEMDCGRREKRRRAIIAAARALFLERGCDAVSLADVVRLSGGSFATLYALFDNKQGLLAAVIREERLEENERILAIMARDAPPAVMLREIACELHDHFTAPATTGLMRVATAEGLRDPHFASDMYQNVHLPIMRQLAALFETWAAAGRARIPDAMLAARLFFGLLLHDWQMRAFFCARAGDAPGRDDTIEQAVAIFAAGYAIDSK